MRATRVRARRCGHALALTVLACAQRAPTDPDAAPGPPVYEAPAGARVRDPHAAWSAASPFVGFVRRAIQGHDDPPGIYLVRVENGAAVGSPVLLLPWLDVHEPDWLEFSPNGARLLFWSGGDVYVTDVANGSARALTAHHRAQQPSWHPSGDSIVYASTWRAANEPQDASGIRVLDLESGDDRPFRHEVMGEPVSGSHPRWDPTGTKIVFTAYAPATGGQELFEASGATRVNRSLTRTGWRCEHPRWIAGGEIVFSRVLPGGASATYVLAPNARAPRWFPVPEDPISLGERFALGPDSGRAVVERATPDGRWIVLWVVDLGARGGRWTQLTGPNL